MAVPLLRSRSTYAPPEGTLPEHVFEFNFAHKSACLWIVGLDGSDLSKRALRLCAMMMNPKHVLKGARDNVVVVTVLKAGETAESKDTLFGDAKNELRSCGIMRRQEWCRCRDSLGQRRRLRRELHLQYGQERELLL